ncbi:nuclear transport factor 2 family protein [Streptomyces sp. NPDC006335]|uniref:nuclear transport factor 2 family protein n=1 Tax=Streptomyces sp. NPDC006335 TaxID=3156895 RepID=UPI0033A50C45
MSLRRPHLARPHHPRRLRRAPRPGYEQHNPAVANGPAGAKAGLGAYFKAAPQLRVEPKRVIAEGDLVAVRRIVEHWDVIQDVPATSANDNTVLTVPAACPLVEPGGSRRDLGGFCP